MLWILFLVIPVILIVAYAIISNVRYWYQEDLDVIGGIMVVIYVICCVVCLVYLGKDIPVDGRPPPDHHYATVTTYNQEYHNCFVWKKQRSDGLFNETQFIDIECDEGVFTIEGDYTIGNKKTEGE